MRRPRERRPGFPRNPVKKTRCACVLLANGSTATPTMGQDSTKARSPRWKRSARPTCRNTASGGKKLSGRRRVSERTPFTPYDGRSNVPAHEGISQGLDHAPGDAPVAAAVAPGQVSEGDLA